MFVKLTGCCAPTELLPESCARKGLWSADGDDAIMFELCAMMFLPLSDLVDTHTHTHTRVVLRYYVEWAARPTDVDK